MKRHVLIYGLIGGILIAVLKWTEYRFLVIEHSIEIYGGLTAAIFAVLGIWLGVKLWRAGGRLDQQAPVGRGRPESVRRHPVHPCAITIWLLSSAF